MTPLLQAAASANTKAWIDLKPRSEVTLDVNKNSDMHLAVAVGNLAIVQLSDSSQSLNEQGLSPAMIAVQSQSLEIFQFLLSKHCVLEQTDSANETLQDYIHRFAEDRSAF